MFAFLCPVLILTFFFEAGLANNIDVYRSPESLFPSGQYHYKQLQEKKVDQKNLGWIKVYNIQTKKEGWALEKNFFQAKDFTKQPDSLARGFAKKNAILYKLPKLESKVLTLLSENEPLFILQHTPPWKHVLFGKIEGYILDDQIIYLNQSSTKAISKKSISLHSAPSNNSPIIFKVEQHKETDLIERRTITWYSSQVSKDLIWWNLTKSTKTSSRKQNSHSIEIKGEVFDSASLPDGSKKFISANGIFEIQKGEKKFKKIDFFKNKNHPLAVAPNGVLFVGPYISYDQGISFKSYVDWKKLISAIHKRTVKDLSLDEIRVQDKVGQKLIVFVSEKNKKYKLYSMDQGKNWVQVK